MKYLIVGGDGFIGHHFCKQLEQDEYVNYDINKPNGNPSIDVINARKKDIKKSVTKIDYDIEYETLIHFGSYAGVRSGKSDLVYFQHNCLEYQKLISKVKFKKLVYISSSSVLGDVKTPYSVSKEICEEITKSVEGSFIFRPFTVFGENGRPEMFVTQCEKSKYVSVFGDPSKIKRRFTYVGDLVWHILSLVKSEHGGELNYFGKRGGVFNVCGKREYSLLDVMEIFGNEYTRGLPSGFDPNVQDLHCDYELKCSTSIEEYAKRNEENLPESKKGVKE